MNKFFFSVRAKAPTDGKDGSTKVKLVPCWCRGRPQKQTKASKSLLLTNAHAGVHTDDNIYDAFEDSAGA